MKKVQKMLCRIVLILVVVLFNCNVVNYADTQDIQLDSKMNYSQEYLDWLKLDDEAKENSIMPRTYNVYYDEATPESYSDLKWARLVGASVERKFSLTQYISENLVIKNQRNLAACWAFSTLGSLETNLALQNYFNNRPAQIFDFSERHLEYATSRIFLNNVTNKNGFNRKVGDGGVYQMAVAYLNNGTGPIEEAEMPYTDSSDLIDISEIQGKDITAKLYDTVEFPNTETLSKEELTQLMKTHIKNYGSVFATIHEGDACLNNDTGALYCNDVNTHGYNHAVMIVGWDDDYNTSNFKTKPTANGAWIIKDSHGTDDDYVFTIEEIKVFLYEANKSDFNKKGIYSASNVPDSVVSQWASDKGLTIEDGKITMGKHNDNGYLYVSYEDVNIYNGLMGILKSSSENNDENIYQYDIYGSSFTVDFSASKIYLGNIFTKKTNSTEYLNEVAITVPETLTCKVYVNPNGNSMKKTDLQSVQLKEGASKKVDAGYHVLELLNPIEITGDKFVVVIETQSERENAIGVSLEANIPEFWSKTSPEVAIPENASANAYSVVTVESGKCFITSESGFNSNAWSDLSTMYDETVAAGLRIPNSDSTIKAFTTNTINDDSLKEIKITTPPNKTAYFEGDNFDKTGMVVTAYLNNGNSNEITEYTITDGNNLSAGKTSVTISYEGKTATQAITVSKNNVESISITTPPTKTSYKAGEDFDKTGMVITATYSNGDTRKITDYEITDGTDLKNGQTSVTISYEGKEVTQTITVSENKVTKIEVTTPPTKTTYVEGQDFDKTGMVVVATYEDGTTKEITSYTVVDGVKLTEDKTSVTIRFEGQETTQSITVSAKTATSIIVKSNPTKITYIQNEEDLDLTGGIITVRYNDGSSEDVQMTSTNVTVEGFDNSELGKNTITVKYLNLSTTFEVDIVAKELKLPENSDFSNASAKNRLMKIYYTSADSSQDYALINVEISNIKKATVNDSLSYAYYLSSKQSIGNIPESDWIKLENVQIENGKLTFQINTKNLKNYDEVSKSDNLYLYIKETAVRESQTKILITGSMNISKPEQKEEYVDGIKKETKPANGGNPSAGDDSIADGKYPFTGKVIVFFAAIVIISLGAYGFVKYRTIDK